MDKIERAIRFACDAHIAQKRKSSGLPYIVHPMEVMKRVSDYGVCDEDVLCAAVLHDVIEDRTDYSTKLKYDFGDYVYNLVLECSREITDDATKLEKYVFLKSFETKSIESIVIKIADRVSNVMDYSRTEGKEKYAATYAMQAYPLYRSFVRKYPKAESKGILSHCSCVHILADIAELSAIVNSYYVGFSGFVDGLDDVVEKEIL
jgi:(p)ppGpp synthase/HD superfamily hydrolase